MTSRRFTKGNITIYHGDCVDILPLIQGGSAVVTDPPYGLSFMGKKWDYEIPSVELWKAALEVLKPGGHLLAFAGTRTYHRMAVNIEDAGFTIRDMVAWMYGTGFPKSTNISKQIDKSKGVKQKAGAFRTDGRGKWDLKCSREKGSSDTGIGHADGSKQQYRETVATSKEAILWDGYGTALKPAHEPICLAMKPTDGTFASNALEHKVAGLNVDGCRIGTEKITTHSIGSNTAFPKRPCEKSVEESNRKIRQDIKLGEGRSGRWPANLIHDGSEEVLTQFPANKSSGGTAGGRRAGGSVYGEYAGLNLDPIGYRDKGSTSRFFYCAKANKKERGEGNNHPTVKPIALMKYLLTLVTYPEYNLIIDPFMGSGSTALAALELGLPFVGIEKEKEYFDIAVERLKNV